VTANESECGWMIRMREERKRGSKKGFL